ncbi:uncharacterized protein LOC124357001 [Homalodisca vitripennis]|uniref:uncharacterized protein LOC124357001 n=1 Tax=Homalodisca vitripennis TaxID=197043 RepID=UPI001EEA11FC|nr:uncharacterized protein LOC124357001 [Homalodisca vitripennis]
MTSRTVAVLLVGLFAVSANAAPLNGKASSWGELAESIAHQVNDAYNNFTDSIQENYGDSDSEEPLYSATISVPHVVNGQCQKTVTVEGNGVNDEIEVPCYMESSIITTNNQLTVGNMIFSNTANTLVVVRDNRCVLKTYKDGKVAGSSPLSRQDCAMVKKVMREVRQNNDAKNWGKWADGVAAAASIFNPAENPNNRFQSFLQLFNIGKH